MTSDILIASETPATLGQLSEILADHALRTVENGRALLLAAHADFPDLILLDLPDSHDICKQLKSDPVTAHIPIIFVAEPDIDLARIFHSDSIDYVSQPLQNEEVQSRINLHLTLQQQRQEIAQLRELHQTQLADFDVTKDRIVRTISHDLKNAIGVVGGYADLLVDETPDHAESGVSRAHYYAARVQKGVKHLLALVTNLVDVVRIEEQIGLAHVPVVLADLLSECVGEARLLAQRKQLGFVVGAVPDLTLLVDPDRVSQALRNLLSNAIKFTPEGGHVELNVLLEPEEVIFQVKDTGLGLPAAEIPRLFRKFHRINRKEYADLEGVGLGLYIAKAITDFHHGRIWAESEPGAGSTFSIALPIDMDAGS